MPHYQNVLRMHFSLLSTSVGLSYCHFLIVTGVDACIWAIFCPFDDNIIIINISWISELFITHAPSPHRTQTRRDGYNVYIEKGIAFKIFKEERKQNTFMPNTLILISNKCWMNLINKIMIHDYRDYHYERHRHNACIHCKFYKFYFKSNWFSFHSFMMSVAWRNNTHAYLIACGRLV